MAKKETKPVPIHTVVESDPLVRGAEAEQMFVSVNGKNYMIQTDTPVDLPPEVYEVIQNSKSEKFKLNAKARAIQFKDKE